MKSACDPQIYWYDLENDKIMINCDDDLRFFMEESEILKISFQFSSQEQYSRKRPSSLVSDDVSECSKRLRRKLQKIDLSSDSSSMDLSSDEEVEIISPESVVQNNTVSTGNEDQMPSTSQNNTERKLSNINIVRVEVIKAAEENINNENVENEIQKVQENEETLNSNNNIDENSSIADNSNSTIADDNANINSTSNQRRQADSNRIVISDSSDDEEEENTRNRRHSDGNYASAYSFADSNGNRFESRTSFDDDFGYYRYRNRFNDQTRNAYRDHAANMNRAFRMAQSARINAVRNMRNTANSIFPQMLSTFQSHFRPLFRPGVFQTNQQYQTFHR